MTEAALERALADEGAWRDLVHQRRQYLRNFLRWAQACEGVTRETSLRLENRDDIARCSDLLELFMEPWWGVVVYSCFDSTTGATVAATRFQSPMPAVEAERVVAELGFPRGSVQHHRTQSTLTGARRSLVSACDKCDDIQQLLFERGLTFEERFTRLRSLKVSWWGRTTCFDVLLRAGALSVSGETYRPEKAYLLGSQGPAAGFHRLWGVRVTAANAELCERVLSRWTNRWDEVASIAESEWDGPPYDSADFENALCVFQEPARRHLPDPAAFAS